MSSHDFCLIYVRTVGASEVVRSATERAVAGGRARGGTSEVSCGWGAAPGKFEVFALHIPTTNTFPFRAQISDQFFDNIKGGVATGLNGICVEKRSNPIPI